METNLESRPKTSQSGLDTVRERAKKQSKVRFPKSENHGDVRSSLQKIKTLKSRAAEAEEIDEECPRVNMTPLGRVWDWFLRTIGNR